MEVAKQSPMGRALVRSGAELLGQQTYIACYLLKEREDPQSFWRPYIDTLPQSFDNVPIFWVSAFGNIREKVSTERVARTRENFSRVAWDIREHPCGSS